MQTVDHFLCGRHNAIPITDDETYSDVHIVLKPLDDRSTPLLPYMVRPKDWNLGSRYINMVNVKIHETQSLKFVLRKLDLSDYDSSYKRCNYWYARVRFQAVFVPSSYTTATSTVYTKFPNNVYLMCTNKGVDIYGLDKPQDLITKSPMSPTVSTVNRHNYKYSNSSILVQVPIEVTSIPPPPSIQLYDVESRTTMYGWQTGFMDCCQDMYDCLDKNQSGKKYMKRNRDAMVTMTLYYEINTITPLYSDIQTAINDLKALNNEYSQIEPM